eukprot:scaffold71803_cov73-Phaeocystis_antarctica.AAC.4
MSASRSVGGSESISSLRKSAGAAPAGSYPSRRSHPPSSTRSRASSLVMLRQPGAANLSSCEWKSRCAPGSSETNASAPRAFGLSCSLCHLPMRRIAAMRSSLAGSPSSRRSRRACTPRSTCTARTLHAHCMHAACTLLHARAACTLHAHCTHARTACTLHTGYALHMHAAPVRRGHRARYPRSACRGTRAARSARTHGRGRAAPACSPPRRGHRPSAPKRAARLARRGAS